MRLRSTVALILPSLFLISTWAFAAPVKLRTEQMTNPMGVDIAKPAFAWQSDASSSNWMQTGYEVMVGTDAAKADVWDSGRVDSSESANVVYSGPALKSQTRYYWQVKVWDNKGGSAVSAPAWFETGLLDASEWKSQWIYRSNPTADKELSEIRWLWLPGVDANKVPVGSTAEFHYKLHMDAAPMRAVLHFVARGVTVVSVNGVETGHHGQSWSAFDWEEIGPILKHGAGKLGDNDIVAKVTVPGTPGPGKTTRAIFAAVIDVTAADGMESHIVSDDHWEAREGAGAWHPAQDAGPVQVPPTADKKPVPWSPSRIATDASLLRKDFDVTQTVSSARLVVTAMGAASVFLNGMPVAPNTLLSPGDMDFNKRVLYQIYDVTALVKPGSNTLATVLGGGWHSSPVSNTGSRNYPGPDMLREQLELTFADGSHKTIGTDGTWLTAPAPILFSEIYAGEVYDARFKKIGWELPGYAAKGWANAAVGDIPADVKVTAQPDLPIHKTNVLHPISVSLSSKTHTVVFDMGQNMVGNIVLHVHGLKGTEVRMRFAERLNPDGSVYTTNLRDAVVTDTYVLSGNGKETYTPSFTFHGFRYVELYNYPGLATKASIEGLVYNSLPAAPTIRFNSSSALLNGMGKLGIWGERGNFFSIPTDCPQRDERLGWMGDAGVFWRTGTYNFDIASFTHKFVNDMDDAQSAEGSFSDVSPNILHRSDGAPGWADAGILVPYAAWMQYGDAALIERDWPAMEHFMDFILKANPDYLRKNRLGANYGDWLAPDTHSPKDMIGTAYWAIIARDMKEMASALGRKDDAAKYQDLYDHIVAAFRKEYVQADGTVAVDTQTSYVLALYSGAAPENLRPNMTDRLVKDIDSHGNHLTTGFLGTPFLMFVLDDNHRADIAYKLLLQDTYPSWGYMVSKGATTWWERWNGDTGDPAMNSYNHYAFGSVMAWVFRRVAGIDTDATGAGYHHLTVKPHFDASLPKLHTEYDSAYGTVTTDWNATSKRYSVTTPSNTTATITLPDGRTENVGSGLHSYEIP